MVKTTRSTQPKPDQTIHTLKIWPQYFAQVRKYKKNFELRFNDRDFQVGDILRLVEFDPANQKFTGEVEYRPIAYILKGNDAEIFGLKQGYCILSFV